MLPAVTEETVSALNDTFGREGDVARDRIFEEFKQEQIELYLMVQTLSSSILKSLGEDVEAETLSDTGRLISNAIITAGMLTWKSLKNQEESNELERIWS